MLPEIGRFIPWEKSEHAKARAPDPNRNPSRPYVAPPSEPPGRFPDDAPVNAFEDMR